jgi:uncharacterized protein (TIGR02594 family)
MNFIKTLIIMSMCIVVGSTGLEARTHKSFNDRENNRHSNYDLIAKAESYIGSTASQLGLPKRLWCADFMNKITGSGSDRAAISYARRGSPAKHGCTNCVAVTRRSGGNHVGIVKDYDSRGNPILISGNHGGRVGVGKYSKEKVVAYRYL